MGEAILFDVLPDGVLVIDGEAIVRRANAAAESLLGYGEGELSGAALATLLPPSPGRPSAPLDAWPPQLGSNVLRAPVWFRKGVSIEVDWSFGEATGDAGERMIVAVLRRRPDDLAPDDGRRAGSRVGRVMQLVFEHAPLGIFHFDERGVITAANEPFLRILGSARERVIGLDLTMLPDPRVHTCITEVLAGRPAGFEGDYTSVTGDQVTPVRVSFEPIAERGGRLLGGVGLAEDVSERIAAERRAAQAERMVSLGTLAAGVVHELQNPLAFVIASLDLAARHLAAPTDAPPSSPRNPGSLRTAVDNAREGAWRVATIVRDLKAFARSDEERRRTTHIEVPIEAAIKLVQNQLRHRATIVREFRAASQVRVAESRLVQVFVNLLLNAAEAIAEGNAATERITISTRDEGDVVAVTFDDTGKGIAPDVIDRLFEPFVTDKPGGMGLGLAICHGIVSALGGTITVEPKRGPAGPNERMRGTRFVVRLPVATVDPSHAPTPKPAPAAPVASGRVLVVDDEERLAETIRMVLSPPHEVEVCLRGRDVLELLRSGKTYDVVLCDLMMPDLSGPELYAEVKATDPKLAERFVFLTGGAFTQRTREFLHEVGNPRLEKPFELEALERVVRDALTPRT